MFDATNPRYLTLHSSIKLVLLFALALLVQTQDFLILVLVAGVLVLSFFYFPAHIFFRMLKRIRWLIVSMMLIFFFNTPGEYIQQWPFELAPTYEGLAAGLLHSLRLGIMLAGLSLLLETSSRESLIAGFYLLAIPFQKFSLRPERFAARLCLTLHYVEQAPQVEIGRSMMEHFSNLNTDKIKSDGNELNDASEHILLQIPAPTWRDGLVVLGLLLAGIYFL
jgi:energy-coupling factor transport system permease protein